MKGMMARLITGCILGIALLAPLTITQSVLMAAVFSIDIVDKNGNVYNTYDWGNIDLDDASTHKWQTVDPLNNGRAVRVHWIPNPGAGEVGIQIYTDNCELTGTYPYRYDTNGPSDNPAGLVLRQTSPAVGSRSYIPVCWRVFSYFGLGNPPGTFTGPNRYQLSIDQVMIDETNIERSLLYDAGHSWPDVNGDGLIWIEGWAGNPPPVRYDMNRDGIIDKCVILSDINISGPRAYVGLCVDPDWNPPWNPPAGGYTDLELESFPGRIGYYPCYLHMLDKYKGDPSKTPMEENPYTGITNACYATIVTTDRGMAGDADGIQHAEHTFAHWQQYDSYVILGANFNKVNVAGEYGSSRIVVELYSL